MSESHPTTPDSSLPDARRDNPPDPTPPPEGAADGEAHPKVRNLTDSTSSDPGLDLVDVFDGRRLSKPVDLSRYPMLRPACGELRRYCDDEGGFFIRIAGGGRADWWPDRGDPAGLLGAEDDDCELLAAGDYDCDRTGCLIDLPPQVADWLPRGWTHWRMTPLNVSLWHAWRWIEAAVEELAARDEESEDDLSPSALLENAYLLLDALELRSSPGCPRHPYRKLDRVGGLRLLREVVEWLTLKEVEEALWPCVAAHEIQRGEQATPTTLVPKTRRMTTDEANQEAMTLAKRMGKAFFLLSKTEQAKRIGCHLKTWEKTEFYRQAQKRKPKVEPAGPGAPRVVNLSDNVLAQLRAEQKEDSEPSPLEDDLPDARPKKVYTRKSL
jgi:hypothetical protein